MENRESLIASNLSRFATGRETGVDEELRLAEKAGVDIVTLLDEAYPTSLKRMKNPPPVLYVKGTLLPEDSLGLAIVGTRSATPYGLGVAKELAGDLARSGITVISGLAEGIDAAGHSGALEAQGRTFAVLGHGLKHLYPSGHRKLAEQIAASGALISQFPMGFGPQRFTFPTRNRVIAGLSLGVVVVEAPEGSGALITAREALEEGREVFAVPGPITSVKSRGCHQLLKEGARLVEDHRDILEELSFTLKNKLEEAGSCGSCSADSMSDLSQEEAVLFEAIPVAQAVSVDHLAGATAMAPEKLLTLLTELELKGAITQIPGQGYSRPA